VIALALVAGPAAADELDDLMKQGAQSYQDGRYEDAIAKLTKAYAMSPKPDVLFALAQAERLGGHCPAAVAHYRKVLEAMTDLEAAKLIQGNIALCEKTEAVGSKPVATAPAPTPASPPRVVVRVEHKTDLLAVGSVAVGTLAVGAGMGLYIASGSTRDAAAGAPTLDQNHTLNSRADLERGLSYVSTGAGVALVGYAIYRWASGHDETGANVALAHGRDGTLLTFTWYK
jgi:tetratricopeptide (TPR) repeat protein